MVSGGIHLLALVLLLLTFASKPETFDPMQETVPIETVSDSEFNKVMQGDKSAKEVVKDATAKVDKVDPDPDPTPKPVTTPADKAVPTPPPPPVEQPPVPTPPTPPAPPPPQAAADPTPPAPTAPPVPTPPTPPARPAPAPAPTVPTPPERVDADAEPIAPKPVPTPPRPPEKVAEAPKPTPPVKPRPVPKPPKAVPKPDQLAKLLDQEPTDQPADKPTPKAAKAARQPAPQQPPSPPQQTEEQSHSFDLTDISRLLSHDAPAQKAATGRAPSKVASLGSPTAHDDKMAPSLWGQLDGLMEEQYRQCWSYLGLNAGQKYVPQIRVTYDESGGLASDPVLVNPPNDPALRSLAESALRAVRRCNPLRIPAQYAPYYDEWKGRVLRFDPQEMAG